MIVLIFTSIAAGWSLPLLPLQILWMNLVTDVFPALALAVEPASPEIMSQPPQSSRSNLLSRPFLFLITWQGILLAALALGAYVWALHNYGPGAHSRTVALFVLIGVGLGHTFNCAPRPSRRSMACSEIRFRRLRHSLLSLCSILHVTFHPWLRHLELSNLWQLTGLLLVDALCDYCLRGVTKLFSRWRSVQD